VVLRFTLFGLSALLLSACSVLFAGEDEYEDDWLTKLVDFDSPAPDVNISDRPTIGKFEEIDFLQEMQLGPFAFRALRSNQSRH
jgi:hypothetical protein